MAADHNDAEHRDAAQQAQQKLEQAHRQIDNLRHRQRDLEQQLQTAGRHNERITGMLESTRGQIEQLKEALEADGNPPFTYASVIRYHPARDAAEGREIEAATAAGCDVLHAGRKMRVSVSPLISTEELIPGAEVLLNENLSIIAVGAPERTGEVARIKEVLPDDRLVIITRGEEERVVRLTPVTDKPEGHPVRIGDAVIVDLRTGTATEVVALSEVEDVVLEESPDVSYSGIGGLADQIEQIRDAVELPFLHAGLYEEHGLLAPKGILLYGPPGTGKTMIAKAVASSLADENGDGAYFLNIKGPELLNKYVGETERHIRVIFSRARERASGGRPVVVFFDEMEALFRTRGTGVSSDAETTIVPQLLAEIDGVESLDNVIVIGASNREDMIDPAILRPGRLDVKIRVQRPSADGAREILRIHLGSDVPLRASLMADHGGAVAAREALINTVVTRLYPEQAGFMSGAVLSNVVDRAKKGAIKEFLSSEQDPAAKGLTAEHLEAALEAEMAEQRAMISGMGLNP
ncbi:MAG: proteasome ATPase [Nesterenkonia sp.]